MSALAIRLLAGLLEERTGQQLIESRQWRVETELAPLMRKRHIASLDKLTAMVSAGRDPALLDAVIDALLNNETSFFRDRAALELLMGKPLDRLAEARATDRRLRIWSAGCSTGQEAYSLAIAFAEQAERWEGWRIEIVGTDVSRHAVERARQGLYSQFEIQRGLSIRQTITWFAQEGEQWRALPDLRERVSFQVQNLLEPAAMGQFDVVLCRNVMLYFTPQRRRAAFARLAQSIAADGVLMLGAGAVVTGQSNDFVSDVECRGLYRPAIAAPQIRQAT